MFTRDVMVDRNYRFSTYPWFGMFSYSGEKKKKPFFLFSSSCLLKNDGAFVFNFRKSINTAAAVL